MAGVSARQSHVFACATCQRRRCAAVARGGMGFRLCQLAFIAPSPCRRVCHMMCASYAHGDQVLGALFVRTTPTGDSPLRSPVAVAGCSVLSPLQATSPPQHQLVNSSTHQLESGITLRDVHAFLTTERGCATDILARTAGTAVRKPNGQRTSSRTLKR